METVARRRTSPAELLRQIVHEWAITIGAKRQRILDAYFDSVIDSAERDKRIAELDRERTALNAIASREKPRATLSLEMLVDTFAPFVEFDLLNREDKRRY